MKLQPEECGNRIGRWGWRILSQKEVEKLLQKEERIDAGTAYKSAIYYFD